MRSTPSSADRAALRGLVATGLLVALAAVLGLVESAVVPPLPVPGVRLGLANIAVVLALVLLGPRRALGVSLGRVLVVGVLAGSLGGPGGLLAAAGALAAWAVMALLERARGAVSVVGVSVGGAAAHVAGQLVAACLVTGSPAPLLFAPLSLALGLACGLVIGYSARLLLSRVPFVRTVEVAG